MKKILASSLVVLTPLMALAQTSAQSAGDTIYHGDSGLGGLLVWFSSILNLAVPIVISIAVVWFIWSVFQYAIAANEEDKAKAKTHIIWGIVGLFIMVSVWGLVGILSNTFSLTNQVQKGPGIPSII